MRDVLHDVSQCFEVARQPKPLLRKSIDEAREEAVEACWGVKTCLADEKVIEAVRIEFAKPDVVAQAQTFEDSTDTAAWVQIADVVDAGAESVLIQREALGPSAREIVLLDDEHALAGARASATAAVIPAMPEPITTVSQRMVVRRARGRERSAFAAQTRLTQRVCAAESRAASDCSGA